MQPASHTESLVGAVLGNTYRVEALLGAGGMGAVYVASHLRLPTKNAIKVLHARVASDPQLFARFRREAEVTSALRHPHIVQVLDFDHLPDGSPFLVMEFLAGEDLHRRLRRVGRLSFAETASLIHAIGGGLLAAHTSDVVHRDLKPQNIFLSQHNQGSAIIEVPKIVDFGISKIRHARADTLQTQDQQLLGTPHYMSPEQARGDNAHVDPRTDQWALGAIAYECLTGAVAFAGGSMAEVMYQVAVGHPARVRTLAPEVPEHAEHAIERALSKDRNARFPSIAEFVEAFAGRPLTGQLTPVTPLGLSPGIVAPSTQPAPRRLWLIGAAAGALLLCAGAWSAYRPGAGATTQVRPPPLTPPGASAPSPPRVLPTPPPDLATAAPPAAPPHQAEPKAPGRPKGHRNPAPHASDNPFDLVRPNLSSGRTRHP